MDIPFPAPIHLSDHPSQRLATETTQVLRRTNVPNSYSKDDILCPIKKSHDENTKRTARASRGDLFRKRSMILASLLVEGIRCARSRLTHLL